MNEILVLFYSQGGSTAEMAQTIAHGVERIWPVQSEDPNSIFVPD